jgi:hypothetical protein
MGILIHKSLMFWIIPALRKSPMRCTFQYEYI